MEKKEREPTQKTESADKPVAQLIPTNPQPASSSRAIHPLWLTLAIVLGMILTAGMSAGIAAYLVRAELGDAQTIEIADQPVSQGVAVVKKVAASVVSISTQTQRYDWFGRTAIAEGAGSGVIVSADGYILTNNHVIEGADIVTVKTTDGEEYEAAVVTTEPEADLALVKVDNARGLVAAEIGNADKLEVGEDVYAVGNALGTYANSVTEGIISGLGRPITAVSGGLRGNLQEFEDLIQTDAAINAGNSGGPLVNAAGQVIGINTAVAGDAQNIGFSIPINRAQELINRARN